MSCWWRLTVRKAKQHQKQNLALAIPLTWTTRTWRLLVPASEGTRGKDILFGQASCRVGCLTTSVDIHGLGLGPGRGLNTTVKWQRRTPC